ncbi:sulfate permease [Gautieria morchelliformis]|nr:sulfate permease [Gautieria morchelliformis]
MDAIPSRIKKCGKAIVDYPAQEVPTISSRDWITSLVPEPKRQAVDYFKSLFPIFRWVGNYNLGWAARDMIAGLTVGIILVPQSMSYAKIAGLPPQIGLYSSVVGVFTYCFFATSKDISIGPVAIMSLETAKVTSRIMKQHPDEWDVPTIATTLALVCGFIVLGLGLLRLGWILEFIPAPVISGFMTGSAITIVAGQVPGLLGISKRIDASGATYLVVIDTLKSLYYSTLDAAFGLVGLSFLYAIKRTLVLLTKRYPRYERIFFFISLLRNAFVMIVLTLASWLYNRSRIDQNGNYPISILGTIPRGFQHVGVFRLDLKLVSAIGTDWLVATIVLLLEHISIAKSFGRTNGYKIEPAQELVAMGIANTMGSFFGAYSVTGAFSRSALNSKSGARTPFAGLVTGLVVIVALYGLTPAFTWVPSAGKHCGLSALIIHAVADIIASPGASLSFWRASPFEFLIFSAAVVVTIFTTIETGIYTGIVASLLLLLLRIARPTGTFLGRAVVHDKNGSELREVFIPLANTTSLFQAHSIVKPDIHICPPFPGVLIYRPEESLVYPNASYITTVLIDRIKETTRRGLDFTSVSISNRPWNDPGPDRGCSMDLTTAYLQKPILRAVVLDLSAASHLDITSLHNLVDVRKEAELWANRAVEFHFANILSPWVRRALIAHGFGIANTMPTLPVVGAPTSLRHSSTADGCRDTDKPESATNVDPRKADASCARTINDAESLPVIGTDTPFFHFDLVSAVRCAEASADRRRITEPGKHLIR